MPPHSIPKRVKIRQMKLTPIVILLATILILSACAPATAGTRPATEAVPGVDSQRLQTPESTVAGVVSSNPSGEEIQQVADVVQGLGGKLQQVSLLSPTAAEEIITQYAGYVSPDLLDQWAADPSKAPGRVTSSPWPDHIEITSMNSISADEIEVRGNIIELTSVEVNQGGVAATSPVEIVLQKNDQGKWWITGWTQGG